jgi:hypothetical protein
LAPSPGLRPWLKHRRTSAGTKATLGAVGSCLEQHDVAVSVFIQPRGEHAAGRSSADDDDVERRGGTITARTSITRSTARSQKLFRNKPMGLKSHDYEVTLGQP